MKLIWLLDLIPVVSLATPVNMTKYTATVDTTKSELCVPEESSKKCFPILIGKDTPKGTFKLSIYKTSQNGYGGEILGFHKKGNTIYAVHRVWTGNPKEQRESRIKSSNISDRLITNGCINITDDGYKATRSMLEILIF